MERYRIIESVGRGVEPVRDYDDLEIHHPTANRHGLRTGRREDFETPHKRRHARVDGSFEEVRYEPDGRVLVKKDFILTRGDGGPVHVPSPVAGHVHYLRDRTQGVRIYDRPFGTPGARLLAQSLHMDPASFRIPEGGRVAYGQPLGLMSDTGTPGSIHAHVEAEPAQFRRYIRDIVDGTIAPGRWPGRAREDGQPPRASARATSTAATADPPDRPVAAGEDSLQPGDEGPGVRALQRRLNALGIRDDRGRPLVEDGEFGRRTREAVESFQREHGLPEVGRLGPRTRAALAGEHGPRITQPRHPDYPLFEDVLGRLQQARAARGSASGVLDLNLAAALVVRMRIDGIDRPARVEFNESAQLVRVVGPAPPGLAEQGRATAAVDVRQGCAQSLHASSDRLAELALSDHGEARAARRGPAPVR